MEEKTREIEQPEIHNGEVILAQRNGRVNTQEHHLPLIRISRPEILYGALKNQPCEFTGIPPDETLLVWKKRTDDEIAKAIDFLRSYPIGGKVERPNYVYYHKHLDFFETISYDKIRGEWYGWWNGFSFETCKRWMEAKKK